MNKFSVMLPKFYPQSREGRKTYSVEQVQLKPRTIHALRVYFSMPGMRAARQHHGVASILKNYTRLAAEKTAGRTESKRLPIRLASVPRQSSIDVFKRKWFFSRTNSPLYLSFLSPGGMQLKHIGVRIADMLATDMCGLPIQTMFEHWQCKQQAIQNLPGNWPLVYSICQPSLLQIFFEQKAAQAMSRFLPETSALLEKAA